MQPLQIELSHVTAGYEGHAHIRDVCLRINRNDFVGIVGRNGGGKTTLLRVILGLLKPLSGTVNYFDENGHTCVRPQMGYLPQHSAIDRDFPITVEETVLSGLQCRKSLLAPFSRELKEMAGKAIHKMELDALKDRPIKALSGGELQRTLMARAIAADPQVLVLDEPNTYIDSHTRERLERLLDKLSGQRTIIMVSHDTGSLGKRATTLVRMDETATISR